MSRALHAEIVNHIMHQKNSNHVIGILLFGSRARNDYDTTSDYDVGIVYEKEFADGKYPPRWDVFLWSKHRWENGFALQLELARTAKILYDRDKILKKKFDFLKRNILPDWEHYLDCESIYSRYNIWQGVSRFFSRNKSPAIKKANA